MKMAKCRGPEHRGHLALKVPVISPFRRKYTCWEIAEGMLLAESTCAAVFAKGAAASVSTLALMKGTLKVMAWTKLKFAVAAAAVVVIGGGSATMAGEASSSSAAAVPPPSAAGAAQVDVTNIDRFVRLSTHEGIPFKATQEVLHKDALPRLYAIMKDPSQSEYWDRAAARVGIIGRDAESAKELVDYAKRPIDWTVIKGERRATSHVIAKAGILRWLGRMGADEVLVRALSPEGANELVKVWIDDPSLPPWGRDKDQVLGMVRGSAAIGLVVTGKKENAARVDEIYQKVAVLPISHPNEELYNQIVDAMAIKQLIAEQGLDRYEQALGTTEMGSLLRPYLMKFDKRRAAGSPAQR